MPKFRDYVAKVIGCFKEAGSWGLTIYEMTEIARNLGWPSGTARRRAYYLATLLEGIGVIQEVKKAEEPNLHSVITPQLLTLLETHSKISNSDLENFVKDLAKNPHHSQHQLVAWRQALTECIEIFENLKLIHRHGDTFRLDFKNLGLIKRDLEYSRIHLK